MCFEPQRRALFQHLNFQKWCEHGVFCTFWIRHVLRAKTACAFSTSQLPKVVRQWGVFYILTSKPASRHNGVHFFDTATSKSCPTLRCFIHFDFEICFAPQRRALFRHLNFQKWSGAGVFCTFWLRNVLRATNHWKKRSVSRLSYLSSDSFSSTLLSSNLSLLSASALLCFSSVHIVRTLTSKLHSTITTTLRYANYAAARYNYK